MTEVSGGIRILMRSLLCPTYSEQSLWSPHGLASCQFGTGPRIIGAFSPRRVHMESKLNARTPWTVLGLVQASASRNAVCVDCPNYLIKSRKNWHWHDLNPHPLGYNSETRAAARLFGHGFLGLLGNEVPHRLGLACVTPNEATTAPTPDQPTTTTTTTTTVTINTATMTPTTTTTTTTRPPRPHPHPTMMTPMPHDDDDDDTPPPPTTQQ
jgi:hypothetical protein